MDSRGNELDFIHKLLHPAIRPLIEKYVKNQPICGPLIVEFDPTTSCNFECPECINIGLLKKGQITERRALDLLSEFYRSGVRGVIFIGGGEPLTHKGISKLLKHAYGLGIAIGLTTNGSLIHQHLKIIAERVKWTRVSIDAATQETFATFKPSQITNSFNKVISNVGNLAKIKSGKLGYSFLTIERHQRDGNYITNCHEILRAANLAKNLGCDYFELKPMVDQNHHLIPFSRPTQMLIREQLKGLRDLNSESFRVISPRSLDHLLNSSSSNQVKNYTRCPTLEIRTVVTPSGIYPCPYKRGSQKNLISGPNVVFDEFWSSQERKFRTMQVNPSIDCNFYCIRHEVNLFLNALTRSYVEGLDLLQYFSEPEVEDDIFV